MTFNKITLSHGNGGILSSELINSIFIKKFNNKYLNELYDSSVVDIKSNKIAFTTDSYTIKPAFFPGGNIGKLSISGTVNDLSVCGAKPMFISCGFIIEEGYDIALLSKITDSMKTESDNCGVQIVTGDTKVIEKGEIDGIFINTSGIGTVENNIYLNKSKIKKGDKVIINGSIGDHSIALLASRNEFPIQTDIKSDCASLNKLIFKIHDYIASGDIRIMRDPTRGGIATTLNELIECTKLSIEINEIDIPIKDDVKAICEITGFDPLYLANEGKVLIICSKESSPKICDILKSDILGADAKIIGEITDIDRGKVILRTFIGGKRIIDKLTGNMLPRIC